MIARAGQRLGPLLVLLLALLGGLVGPAAAHTDLVSTSPAQGERLDVAPTEITLTFSEEMSPELSAVTLRTEAADGLRMKVRAGTSSTALVAEVPTAVETRPGTTEWRVAYRVVSRDGHPVTGEMRFEVRVPQAPETPSTPPSAAASTAPPTASGEEASEVAPQSGEGPPWGLVVGGAVVLLVLLGLAVAAGIRLARRGAAQ